MGCRWEGGWGGWEVGWEGGEVGVSMRGWEGGGGLRWNRWGCLDWDWGLGWGAFRCLVGFVVGFVVGFDWIGCRRRRCWVELD